MIAGEDRKVFWCDCADPAHHLILEVIDFGDGYSSLLLSIHPDRGFFERLGRAFNYVFRNNGGYLPSYGEVVLDHANAQGIVDALNAILDDRKAKGEEGASKIGSGE